MTRLRNTILVACALAFSSFNVLAAGFRTITVEDPGSKPITAGLWYPSDQAPPKEPNTLWELPVALDAPVGKTNGALIVISHGYGGWYAGHADTAAVLADAGFIVAAPSHTGNTWSDMSSSIDQWMLDRPRHISRVIDQVLSDSALAGHIDENRIGFYGFSAGGFTALSLLGATPDFDRAAQHCKTDPSEWVCKEGLVNTMLSAGAAEIPAAEWGADNRIQAAVIAAPGFGFAYSEASLAKVSAAVQLWSGEFDHSVPTESNAGSIAEKLPVAPETHWVKGANHFAFMVVQCRESFKQADPAEYKVICGDLDGFDRYAFHETMHRDMIRFYEMHFGL